MTPAINLLKKAKANFKVHQYDHDPDSHSYGEEAVEKMGQDANQVFKTLLVKLDGRQLAVAVVPVAGMLDLKAMAAACGAKKAVMAEQPEAERSTGYLLVFRKVKTTGFSRSALAMIFCRSYLDVEVLRWTTGMAVTQYLIFSTTLCLSRSTGIRCSREMLA
ncbi:YbaK/EbsC family protein [Endozoicomonas ascidiicola]|uniref:YbaK/EbsC family protein n=1 Tax=Endozoicomonas ascidiicola TaxID=1698521 RepID=UPI000A508C68|nr:YbaK/EbsC family protein [Endozoicomonas ascidiicola]